MKKYTVFISDEALEGITRCDDCYWGGDRDYFTSFVVQHPSYEGHSESESKGILSLRTVNSHANIRYNENTRTYSVEAHEHSRDVDEDGYGDVTYDVWKASVVEGVVDEVRDGIQGVVVELDDKGFVA